MRLLTERAGRQVLDRLIVGSRLPELWAARFPSSLAVLAYHGVEDPESFERQMAWLADRRVPIGLEELAESSELGQPVAAGRVLVTFDDGCPSVVDHALPILERYGVPGIAFVVAGLIDTDQPYWWREVEYLFEHGARSRGRTNERCAEAVRRMKQISDGERRRELEDLRASVDVPPLRSRQLTSHELRRLEAGGIAIGNHSLTHPCLDRCESVEAIRRELSDSQVVLSGALGHRPRAIAYPNGNRDRRVLQVARDMGFELGFLFDHELAVTPPSERLTISRLRVSSSASVERLEMIVSGFHSRAMRLRNRLRAARASSGACR